MWQAGCRREEKRPLPTQRGAADRVSRITIINSNTVSSTCTVQVVVCVINTGCTRKAAATLGCFNSSSLLQLVYFTRLYVFNLTRIGLQPYSLPRLGRSRYTYHYLARLTPLRVFSLLRHTAPQPPPPSQIYFIKTVLLGVNVIELWNLDLCVYLYQI